MDAERFSSPMTYTVVDSGGHGKLRVTVSEPDDLINHGIYIHPSIVEARWGEEERAYYVRAVREQLLASRETMAVARPYRGITVSSKLQEVPIEYQ